MTSFDLDYSKISKLPDPSDSFLWLSQLGNTGLHGPPETCTVLNQTTLPAQESTFRAV